MKNRRTKTILFCIVYIFTMILSSLPHTIVKAAGTAPESGTGTSGDPYIIDEPSELVWMQENYSTIYYKYFRQIADLNMNGVSFTPIGNGGSAGELGTAFSGVYDGQEFKIQNLTVNTNLMNAALFQDVSGTVKNVALENVSITSTCAPYNYANAAGIAGYGGNCTISNCSVSGTISVTDNSPYSYAGGIIGTSYGTVQDCYSTASLSNVNSGGGIGGIAGYTASNTGAVSRCYFAGSLSGAATTKGAIVGNYFQCSLSANFFLSTSASWALGSTQANTGATSASDADMKKGSTFTAAGWDFTNIWKINEGVSYPTHITAPSKPVNLQTAPDDGQITLSWNAADRTSGYLVYYGTSPGAYGTPVASTDTSEVITGLTNGTLYYFAVKGLHTAEEGPLSDPVTGKPHDTINNLAAVPDDGKVDLTFSAPAGATTVELQQSTTGAAGPFSAVTSVSLTAASTSATVTGLTNGTEYTYRLRLLYDSDEYFSNTATATAGNADATLSALTVSGCTFTPSFASDTFEYTASVASNVSSATVTATVNSVHSILWVNSDEQPSGTGKTINLSFGNNTIDIWVQAQNGDYLEYVMTITRQLPTGTVTKDADASIDNVNWPPYLYAGWYNGAAENAALKFSLSSYSGTVTYAQLRIYVSQSDCTGSSGMFSLYGSDDDSWTTALPSSKDAAPILYNITRPTLSGNCWITMDVTDYVKNHLINKDKTVSFYLAGYNWGSDNDIAFYPASDSTYKPCMVLLFQSDDARLSGISIDGTPLSGFSKDTYTYSYVAPRGTDLSGLHFTSTLNDAKASQGNWTYDAANKKWTVLVTAESGSTKTYTVNVSTLLNSDATLSSISINGTQLSGFSPATQDYTYDVPHGSDGSSLVLSSVLNDSTAAQGSWTYNGVQRKWSVLVTAENGTTQKTYTVSVNELPSTDATLQSIKVNGSFITGFSSATLNYTYDVPHGTNIAALSLSSVVNDANATQSAWTYDSTQKKWSVLVTAEDGTTQKTYTVTINELPNNDATLKTLKVNGTAITGFTSSTLDYTYDVLHGLDGSTLALTSEVNDPAAAQGTWTYNSAQKKWSVLVTAEDATIQKTYAVTVHELPNTDATLRNIKAGSVNIPGFASAALDYTYDAPHGTDPSTLVMTGETTDPNATQGAWTYDNALMKWSVLVTAEDTTTTKTYTVTINVLPSDDATLKNIRVNGTDIAGFSPSTLDYVYYVAHGADSSALSLTSEANDHAAVQGSWTYNSIAKKWSVLVTAENGTAKKTYSVTVAELPNNDATLKNIKINGTDVAGFSASTLNYTHDVAHGFDSSTLVITSAVNDSNATQGAWTYNSTLKKWSMTVTAEDGTTKKTYSVTVNELPNTDATLKSIKVNGTALSSFSASTLNYLYNAAHGTSIAGLALTSEPTDPNAAQSAWTYDSALKKWSVTVTAQDTATKKTYTVTVHELPNTDATLSYIRIDGELISGFTKTKLNYTYSVPYGTDASGLYITSQISDSNATQGSWTYSSAQNRWSVKVTAEDGVTQKTYTVTVNELASSPSLTPAATPSATPSPSPSPSLSPTPSATPAVSPAPSAAPSPSAAQQTLAAHKLEAVQGTDTIAIELNISDLPQGTTAIRLPDGQVAKITGTAGIIRFTVSKDKLDKSGNLSIVALNSENAPSGTYTVAVLDSSGQLVPTAANPAGSGSSIFPILTWVLFGLAGIVAVVLIILIIKNKKNNKDKGMTIV